MISVDDRIGSIELIPILQSAAQTLCSAKHKVIPQITSTRLIAGDVCFDGNGQGGKRVAIGIERKRLRDMISSIRTGRYAGSQLPMMLDLYDDCYLIIEGYQRCGQDGELESLLTRAESFSSGLSGRWAPLTIGNNQTFRFTELDHFICTMERCTRVKVRRTHSDYETSAQIISLYSHYQEPYDSHHGHQAMHTPQHLATIGKAGLVRRVAACLAGVGWNKSAAVALKFRTVEDLINAGPEEWRSIPGIGKTLAKRAFDQLRGEYKDPGEL